MDEKKEIIILGAGPSGIAAAIYLKRAGHQPLLLENHKPGGLLHYASLVENYPGFPGGITGQALGDLFLRQLYDLKVPLRVATVQHVSHHDDAFHIQTDKELMQTPITIVATGTVPRQADVKGSDELKGKYVFYDPYSIPSSEDPQKKRVLVIGGGDLAFDYTLTLVKQGYDVTILCRSKPRCLPLLWQRVRQQGVSIYSDCHGEEIQQQGNSVLLRCRHNAAQQELTAEYILVACGRDQNISFLHADLKRILQCSNRLPATSLPGLYFAGDVIRGRYRQLGIAVGDGIHAAMMIDHSITERMANR